MEQTFHSPQTDATQATARSGLGIQPRTASEQSLTAEVEDASFYSALKAAMEADDVGQQNMEFAVDDGLSWQTQSPASATTIYSGSGAFTPVGRTLISSPVTISAPEDQFQLPEDARG